MNRDSLDGNFQLQDALIRKLEVIGEATKGLSQEVTNADPDIPWTKIAGMRDRMVHQYFRIDLDIVWATVTSEIPKLHLQVKQLYETFAANENE